MTHANANVKIHRNVSTTISTIHIHASVSVSHTTVPKRTISIKMSASANVSTTHTYGVRQTLNTITRLVVVYVNRSALLPMCWTWTSVSVCATKPVNLGTR